MLGLAYIAVPLYQIFCQTYGFGGTVQKTSVDFHQLDAPTTSPSNEVAFQDEAKRTETAWLREKEPNGRKSIQSAEKPLTIHFNANHCNDLPWELKPSISKMKVYPGDTALTFYTAENESEETLTGVATYNVTPPRAGIYFNKIQCFCFEEQRLKGKETTELPILFFIDSEFHQDPKMKGLDNVTLSYTFFKT